MPDNIGLTPHKLRRWTGVQVSDTTMLNSSNAVWYIKNKKAGIITGPEIYK